MIFSGTATGTKIPEYFRNSNPKNAEGAIRLISTLSPATVLIPGLAFDIVNIVGMDCWVQIFREVKNFPSSQTIVNEVTPQLTQGAPRFSDRSCYLRTFENSKPSYPYHKTSHLI